MSLPYMSSRLPYIHPLPSTHLSLPRLSQLYYLQVSAWMIRLESELGTREKMTLKVDINNRASLFIQVGCMIASGIMMATCMVKFNPFTTVLAAGRLGYKAKVEMVVSST